MPPRSGDCTAAIRVARSTGCSLRYNRLPSGEGRKDRQLVTIGQPRCRVDVSQIQSAQWLSWQPLPTRQGAQTDQRITHSCRMFNTERQRVEAQNVGIAREEQNANADRGNGSASHEWKLP